jgi:hypothetical protein
MDKMSKLEGGLLIVGGMMFVAGLSTYVAIQTDMKQAKIEVACRKAVDSSKDKKIRKDPLRYYLECVEGNSVGLLANEKE